MLKFKEELFKVVKYNDLDRFIQDYFDTNKYEFVADMECSNYTNIKFDIDGNDKDLDEDNIIYSLQDGRCPDCYSTRTILNYLCRIGVIEPGKYFIEVYW